PIAKECVAECRLDVTDYTITRDFMTNKQRTTATTYLLIGTLLFPPLIFGQQPAKADAAKTSAVETTTSASAGYLLEVSAGYDTSQEYSREAQAIANVLSSN